MKINKVLLGLFAGVFALTGGVANAQFEIGPSNIGGKVSSLILDNQDGTTLYAGAISGGLYVRTTNTSVLQNIYAGYNQASAPVEELVADTGSWHMVPLQDANGTELTLPISAMVQLPNGDIIIGTGDNTYSVGSIYTGKMSSMGRGIYRYTDTSRVVSLMTMSIPTNFNMGNAVRNLDYYYRNDTLFLFAATNEGLFRWTIDMNNAADWNKAPVRIQAGDATDIVVARDLNIAYFSCGNQLYRISNAAKSNTAINISSANTAFGGSNTAIKLALAPSDNNLLYAMVIDRNGIMEGIYLSTNGNNWTSLATESVTPIYFYTQRNTQTNKFDTIVYTPGTTCATITVDPTDARHIYVGGTNIWEGQGYEGVSNFMWSKNSYSEWELNRGDYMGSVFNSSFFVHSGIQKMVAVWNSTPYTSGDQTYHYTYYIATDGGIYSTRNNFTTFENINRGLNNIQITSVDVCPDGSLISAAAFNGCPFIESRLAHSGGEPTISWYDYGNMGNLNHNANILWYGSGRKVAASAIYQLSPQSRRNIFVASNGAMGRSYADYLNYNNTQTWTINTNFLTDQYYSHIGDICLWENPNDNTFKDSIKVNLDLRGYYFKANGDTIWINQNSNLKVSAGQKAVFLSKNNSSYPFMHTFTAAEVGSGANQKTVADTFLVKNPVVSRMLAVLRTPNEQYEVVYSWTVNDFTRVYDQETFESGTNAEREKMMKWVTLFSFPHNENLGDTLYPRCVTMSPDGNYAYFCSYNSHDHKSQLFRIQGFNQVNFNQKSSLISDELSHQSTVRKLKTHNLDIRGHNYTGMNWFSRPISSITVDPRPGQDRIIVTFEDYSGTGANVVEILNASDTNAYTINEISITGHGDIPAYCAMIEKTTGNIYVGTSEGLFIYNGASWSQYDKLKGVAVTSLVQQTRELPVMKHLGHTGINEDRYIFSKSKWPGAIYIGTYGRGIFIDTTYITDHENEVCDPHDLSVPTVASTGANCVNIYPNPVSGEAHLNINAAEDGNASLRIYDLNGRVVVNRNLGHLNAGEQTYTFSTEGLNKGMYLINVTIGGHTTATKMLVR